VLSRSVAISASHPAETPTWNAGNEETRNQGGDLGDRLGGRRQGGVHPVLLWLLTQMDGAPLGSISTGWLSSGQAPAIESRQ